MEFIFTCNPVMPRSFYGYQEDTEWSKKKKKSRAVSFLKITFLATLLNAVRREKNEKFRIT